MRIHECAPAFMEAGMSNPTGTVYRKRNPEKRLHENTYHNPKTGCWEFLGTIGHNGYASIWYFGKMRRVNRLSAHLFLGMDLENQELVVCHKDICKSRRCWNPEHLYIGAQADNISDSIRAGTFHNGADNLREWRRNRKNND